MERRIQPREIGLKRIIVTGCQASLWVTSRFQLARRFAESRLLSVPGQLPRVASAMALAFRVADRWFVISEYSRGERYPRDENERSAMLCRLVQGVRGSLPLRFIPDRAGRDVAYSAASPMVHIVLPSGMRIGSAKRRDQFTSVMAHSS